MLLLCLLRVRSHCPPVCLLMCLCFVFVPPSPTALLVAACRPHGPVRCRSLRGLNWPQLLCWWMLWAGVCGLWRLSLPPPPPPQGPPLSRYAPPVPVSIEPLVAMCVRVFPCVCVAVCVCVLPVCDCADGVSVHSAHSPHWRRPQRYVPSAKGAQVIPSHVCVCTSNLLVRSHLPSVSCCVGNVSEPYSLHCAPTHRANARALL